MGYVRGFNAQVSIGGSSIVTLQDISVNDGTNAIPIETLGDDKVRNVPGMKNISYTFTVLAGTDPKVPGSADGFSLLKGLSDAKSTFEISFSSGGASFSDDVFVSSFAVTNPVNGIASASVTCVPSAMDGSGSGSGG